MSQTEIEHVPQPILVGTASSIKIYDEKHIGVERVHDTLELHTSVLEHTLAHSSSYGNTLQGVKLEALSVDDG